MLMRLPPMLDKSLQIVNVSRNRLKSLAGLENCINLRFLNANHNQLISPTSSIVILQSLRELLLSHNLIPNVKELGQLKNLTLLDLSHNKIVEFDKL
jgi:Leucine-rich repeat (LRR) protein